MKKKSSIVLSMMVIGMIVSACDPPVNSDLPVVTPPVAASVSVPTTQSASPDSQRITVPEPSAKNDEPASAQPVDPKASPIAVVQPSASADITQPSPAPSSSISPDLASVLDTNLATVSDLEIVSQSTNSVTVQWDFPSLGGPSSYNLFLDNQLVSENVTRNVFTFTGLKLETSYNFEVETVFNGKHSKREAVSGKTTVQGSTGIGNFSGSSGGGGAATPTPTPTPTPVPTPTPAVFMQMERLARPAINEGLIISNNLLNTWNMVPPSVDLTAAAQPIAAEATAVLMALGNTQLQVDALFTALLPDVMRIDTTIVSGYTAANTTAQLRPIGGRMITDDVIDLTLALAVPGGAPGGALIPNVESDNVTYAGPNAGGTMHKPVLAGFPYLAAPN